MMLHFEKRRGIMMGIFGGNFMTDIISQGLGILGAALNISSFQMKSNKKLILCQFLGSTFFLFNYLLLNAYTGCIMNGLGVIRNFVFLGGDKTRKPFVLILVNLAFITGTIFTWQGFISIFPLVGMIAATVTMYMNSGKAMRMAQLFISSPCWLVYNLASMTIGGVACEIFVITSTAISFIRFGMDGFER